MSHYVTIGPAGDHMIVSPIQPSQTRYAERNDARRPNGTNETPAASTALVPVTPPEAIAKPANSLARPNPAFVAHLIAMAQQAPQTRMLRRASPDEAQARYRAQPAATAARGVLTSKII